MSAVVEAEVPYAVRKAISGSGWLLLPEDALLGCCTMTPNVKGGLTSDGLLLWLVGHSHAGDDGSLLVTARGIDLATALDVDEETIGARFTQLHRRGQVETVEIGHWGRGFSTPSTWRLLPEWCYGAVTGGEAR